MAGYESLLQPSVWLMMVLLLLTRFSTAMPGLYSIMKRDGVEVTAVKEPLHTETAQLIQLRREIEQLSRELMTTKEQLELLKLEMNRKYDNINALSPAHYDISCRTAFTWWHEAVGRSLEFLDNFDIHCGHGEFLRQWRMTWGERDKKKAIRYVCCRFRDSLR